MRWVVEGFGVAAVVLSAVFFAPQAVRAVRHGTPGVSTATFQMVVVLSAVWLIYGIVEDLPALVVGNVPPFLAALVVLGACRRDGARLVDVTRVAAVCTAGAVLVGVAFGIEHIGWVSAALGVSMRVPQLRAVRRATSIAGVSATTWALGIASNVCWFVYGAAHGDIRVPVACVIQIALATSLLRAIARRRATTVTPAAPAP